jgi:hypothetical protein
VLAAARALLFSEKRVSDQRSDACFHGWMVHRPRARFATPAPTKAGGRALVLSRKCGHPLHDGRTLLINSKHAPTPAAAEFPTAPE